MNDRIFCNIEKYTVLLWLTIYITHKEAYHNIGGDYSVEL